MSTLSRLSIPHLQHLNIQLLHPKLEDVPLIDESLVIVAKALPQLHVLSVSLHVLEGDPRGSENDEPKNCPRHTPDPTTFIKLKNDELENFFPKMSATSFKLEDKFEVFMNY